MAKKQYLDLDGLTTYDGEIKAHIEDVADGKSDTGHTHNYAGSSSAGGAATSANKLNTNAGSATQPVYFADGVPKATTYTLGKSVPSDAVFTDTTYSAASSSLGLVKSGGDVTISSGVITVNDDSHNHTIANVDNLQSTLDSMNEEIDGSITGLSVSGKVITYTKNDGTTGTITTQDTDTNTDTKVTNTLATTTKAYVTGTTSSSTNTGTQVFDTGVYLDTTAGQLVATTFKGALSGNATTATSATSATSATKATQDASGNTITSTYETKTDATAKLAEAKTYADTAATTVKNDLLNGAGTAYDTLKELGDLIDTNADAIDALETIAAGKADASHTHNYAGSSSAGGSATSAVKLATARYIDGVKFTGEANVTRYATCSTAAATVAKTASITAGTFSLATGARVTVKFTYANTAASPTLNIGSTGAKAIYWHGAALPSSQYWAAGAVLDFVYNGTQWDLIGVGDTEHTHTVSHTPAGTVANASITPAGTVSKPTFTGTAASHKHTFTGTAASHDHTFTGTEATLSADLTPAGTVTSTFTGAAASHDHTFTGGTVTSGTPSATATVASSTHTHKYTPTGTVSQPTFTGTAVTSGASSGTTSVYSITGVGSVPSLTGAVSNHCLTLTFSAGSVPTRSSVTLPSTSHTHSVTAAGTVSKPTFTGTEASTTSISGTTSVAGSAHTHSVTASGTVAGKSVTPAGTITSTFTGTEAEIAIDYTPAGTVGSKSVTPAGTISDTSVTPAGTVSQPTFTGTAASHNHTFTGTAATLTTSSAN